MGHQDLLVTHTLTPGKWYRRTPQRQRPPRQRLCSNGVIVEVDSGLSRSGHFSGIRTYRSPARFSSPDRQSASRAFYVRVNPKTSFHNGSFVQQARIVWSGRAIVRYMP